MKKRENHLLKSILMMAMTLTLIACGSNNESGGGSSSRLGYSYSGITSQNGIGIPSNWQRIVENENPCVGGYSSTYNGSQGSQVRGRTRVVLPLHGVNINAGAVHVGVTAEGDIAIASNRGSGPQMEMFLCPRPDLTGQGQLTNNPVLNTSQSCGLSEMTDVDVRLSSSSGYGAYQLLFFPIHIPNAGKYSSLCR